ncbi:TPA: hypothetical protein R1740_001667, partial [Campylobacter lari]|nr:hypothetical protein [Campylobacter lari]
YFDIQRYLNNVRKIYITPEFGTNAQTLICLSNILNIKSIIVQPIASTPCKPYPLLVPSAIFCMDMIYKDKYIEKGYDKNIIFEMGSARMRNILRKSQKIKKMDLMPNFSQFTIFFALQHSMSHVMIKIYEALKEISLKLNVHVVIKFHPNQDLNVLKYIYSDNISNTNIILMDKDDDSESL